jgi:hypothetical protein
MNVDLPSMTIEATGIVRKELSTSNSILEKRHK